MFSELDNALSLCIIIEVWISISAGNYIDFGYDVISASKTQDNGVTELSVTFRAPADTETYWDLDGIPILELDRFSSVSTKKNNSIFVSTMTTSKEFNHADLYSFSFRPEYVEMNVVFPHSRSKYSGVGHYESGCSYIKPQHNSRSVDIKFRCKINTEMHAKAKMYVVRNQSSSFKYDVIFEEYSGDFFELKTERDGKELNVKITTSDPYSIENASVLGMFGLVFEYRSSEGPVRDITFSIEGDVDFSGTQNPLYGQKVIITNFYYLPQPQVQSTNGAIICSAIGNPQPTLDIFKIDNSGKTTPVDYPAYLFHTRYRATKFMVINYPMKEDSGNYTCIARSGGKIAQKWQVTWFEPPPQFVNNATRIDEKEDGTIVIRLKVTGFYGFDVSCYKDDEPEQELIGNTKTKFKYKGIYPFQTTSLKFSLKPVFERPRKITCKASDIGTGSSFYTIDI